MTTKRSTRPCSCAHAVRALARDSVLGVGPVRDHRDRVVADALRHQPAAHVLADRDDAGRMREPEPNQPVEDTDDDRVVEPAKRDRDLGEDVLRDDQERSAVPPCDRDPDRGDERWVGQAEHELRPRAP